MKFSDWIMLQIETLRSMIAPDEPPPIPPDGVVETPTETGVVLKFLSNPANLSRARKAVEKFCETTTLDQPARDEVGLVVNEAVANIMRHAYGNVPDKPIEIDVDKLHDGIHLTLRDWGNGVDPSTHMEKMHDPMVPGGLGLICLRKLMDGLEFIPQPDGMLLEMTRTTNGSKARIADGHKAGDAIAGDSSDHPAL